MGGEISRFVEQEFNVKVDEAFIIPLWHSFFTQLRVALDQDLTLEQSHEILTKIDGEVSERFGTEETTVIPRPV